MQVGERERQRHAELDSDTMRVRAVAAVLRVLRLPGGTLAGVVAVRVIGCSIRVHGELRLGARTAIGAGLRAHVMGQFEHYGHDHTATAAGYDDDDRIPVNPELAAQGLFHVSYRL